MTEENEEAKESGDLEDLIEALEAEREERQEQVSFEWVETVRRAGELWRDVEDAESVAEEAKLSLETTKEALTVYRLIFDDPSDVPHKTSEASRAYFSLDQEVEEVFDEVESDEPVEELLREYVGALYLDHDTEEVPVGEPPEKETPPMAFDWEELDLDVSELIPSFEIPMSTIAVVADMPEIHDELFQNQISTVAAAMDSELFQTQEIVSSAIQPVIAHQNEIVARSLAPLTAAIQEQQDMIAQSTAVMLSDAVQDIAFPDSVLADLASFQPALNAAATATTHTHHYSGSEDSVADEASKTSVEAEPLEATVETGPEFSPVDATVDSTLPDTSTFTTELVVEIPTMVVESILSTGNARVWFSNLSEEHQLTAVRLLLASVAVYITGNPFAAPVAIIPAPSVRRAIVMDD